MVVVLKHGVAKESRDQLISWLKNLGLNIHVSEASSATRRASIWILSPASTLSTASSA